MLEVGNSRQITDIKDFLGTCRRSDVTGFTLKMVENTHEFHIQSAGDPSFLVVANDKEKALETATQQRYGNSSKELCKRKQG